MKKFHALGFVFLALALVGASVSLAIPVRAAEEEAAPDTAKKGGEEGSKESGKKKNPADVSGGRFSGDPVYVHLAPMTLPILGPTGPEQLVTIQITVEVKDFDTVDDMHARMPRVMDTLLQVLYGGLGQGSLRNGRLADIGKIKTKAMMALQGMEGNDNIKDVLIINMSQRLL